MPPQADLPMSGQAREAAGSSARLAILLSAAVGPGAGHFAQRRWFAGALYLAAFVVCLVMAIMAVVVPLMINLRITLDFAEKGSSEVYRTISIIKVLVWSGLTVLVYLAALADVIASVRRQARRRLESFTANGRE